MKRLRSLWLLLLLVAMVTVGCGQEDVVSDNYENDETSGTVAEETSEETAEETAEETVAQPVVKENEFLTEYPFTFTDKFGNEVTIEEEPQNLVSFAPEITETIFAMGIGDKLIGRSTYCDYPAEAAEVPDLGTLFELNLEAIIEKEPDLVFLSSMVSEDQYKTLVDSGLTVFTVDYDDKLVGTMDQIQLIGDALNRVDQANAINGRIQDAIDDLTAKQADRDEVSMYFVVSAGEYTSTATGDTFMHDIIQTVGARNVAEEGTYWMYTVEQLVEDDPDVMLCSNRYDMKATIETLEGYKDLRAVTEGHLYEVDENIFFRQGPRVVEAMYVLEAILFHAQ